ncbi:MAG: glycogen debranching enzyme N-terminal domain-containing protein [Candidatus Micrarchaeota archaeon]|nr:glycogen debranching enzyme N-terminal domain-containing protein [Candidatus Micrarchaeota archaeon]
MFSLSAMQLVPSEAAGREWLVANGLGGYASSTVIGMNTRKYHGLLVAPLQAGKARHVLLSKLEDFAVIGGTEFSLSTNAYPGAVYPTGYRHQTGFSFSTHPTFTYAMGDCRIEKSVRMIHGKNTVLVSYRLLSGKEASIEAKPLLSLRPIHADPSSCEAEILPEPDGLRLAKPAPLRIRCLCGKFRAKPEKYYNMLYEAEKKRGYPHMENLLSAGSFSGTLFRGEELHICASLEQLSVAEALELADRQQARIAHLLQSYARQGGIERTDFGDALALAADSFVIQDGKQRGIIAGYHWFSQWGRDAMISLPGILLATGRAGMAREVLLHYANKMEDGLLPNFIDENGEAHYNSADASLWFVNAVRHYIEATGDHHFIRESLWTKMRQWLSSTMQGNSLVRMESDCLLYVSDPASTWMDAKVDGKPVTPRKGKPVEINALWHSCLVFLAQLSQKFGDRRTEELCLNTAEQASSSFQKILSADGWLFDVIEPNDSSLRPNQIFAVSLPASPLNHLQQRHVFNAVRSRLYTPLGLRTLAPSESRYCERYEGPPPQRDFAYHQGMIWPWLLGAFYDAQLRVQPGSERQVLASLKPIYEKMSEGCIGSIAEIYEPASGKPAGAVSQAWSVGEIMRIYTKVKKAAISREPSQPPLFSKVAVNSSY